jgi:hypothetical protein
VPKQGPRELHQSRTKKIRKHEEMWSLERVRFALMVIGKKRLIGIRPEVFLLGQTLLTPEADAAWLLLLCLSENS